MKLQIQHHRDVFGRIHDNLTVAIYQPSREILEALEHDLEANREASIQFQIGIARMHPKEDRWVKRIGREIALKNMKPVRYTLRSIVKNPGEINYSFYSETNGCATFLLSTGRDTAFLYYVS